MKKTAVWMARLSILAAALSSARLVQGATPALPAPDANGVVTLANQDYVITEADDLTGITKFQTTGGWLVFDISQGSFNVDAAIKGTGGIEKRGEGALYLNSSVVNNYQTSRGLHAVAGELHLPKADSGEHNFGEINIDKDAIVFVVGSDSTDSIRTLFTNLTGSGTLTNGWGKAQIIEQVQNTISTNFSGVIGGRIAQIWVYPSSELHLTGTNSTFTCAGSMPGFGRMYVSKIGYDASDPSSAGVGTVFTLGPNGGDTIAGLYYTGPGGETTTKQVNIQPWHATVTQKCVLDAGAGGIVWNGNFTFSRQPMSYFILQGDGAPTNVFGGTVTDQSSGASYFEKRGAGTWLFKKDNNRKGVTAVKEGTFQFETLREQGVACSLGLSTLTHSAYSGGFVESRAVPYALVLGGGEKGEATLEFVGRAGDTADNVATNRPLVLAGDGRLKTTGPQLFSLSGVSSISATPCTLALDGTNTVSALMNVTNGTSALSLAKDGPGTWTLKGNLDFSGSLVVNDGTLLVEAPDTPYTWYKLIIKTVNSYYSGNSDSCRVTHEFALYDADGVRRNIGLVSNTSKDPNTLQPGQATVGSSATSDWAFENSSFLLSRMFDDDGGTASFLKGPSNGTAESTWISVFMRLSEETPPITSFDMISNGGTWNTGTRRTVAYSVCGSTDGRSWNVLSEQTTNETARFTSGWYSNGGSFTAGAVRPLPDNGIAIAPWGEYGDGVSQLTNVSDVVVAAGATLKARGTVALRRLGAEIDATGAVVKGGGTLDGFAVASNGVFNITGAAKPGPLQLPYAFVGMKDFENFKTWKVAVNGVPAPSLRATFSTDGVKVYSVGFYLIVR